MKNAIVIAFLGIIFCPVLLNTGVFTYYSINIKAFTEKFCINKAEPELRCNGKCKLKSIMVSPSGSKTKSNKNKTQALKIPFYIEKAQAFSFSKGYGCWDSSVGHFGVYQILTMFLEISTPPPQ